MKFKNLKALVLNNKDRSDFTYRPRGNTHPQKMIIWLGEGRDVWRGPLNCISE